MRIVITGGHHTSALPVIKELKKQYSDLEIHWIGHKHSVRGDVNDTLEYKEITSLKIPFYNLRAGKLYKTTEIKRLMLVPLGFFHALYLLIKIKPDVVLSFGGYLAAPTVFMAWFLGIPSLTHEQTVVAGYANKFIARFADKVLISWEESRAYFKRKDRKGEVIYTGLPLRREIFDSKSNTFLINKDLTTIYITAGKTGSHRINEVVGEALGELLTKSNIIHQVGGTSVYSDYEDLQAIYSDIKDKVPGKYHIRKFVALDVIGEAFSKADLVVGRSGAHIISEVLALNKPTLLIPIPWVSHNEQYKNAKVVKDSGLGRILEEKNLTSQSIISGISLMFNDLKNYKQDKKYSYEKDSAQLIVNEIQKTLPEKA